MSTAALLPWHKAQWQRLQDSRQQGRLPHALLLTGAPGIGKNQFAESFAQSLLCESLDTNSIPCGQCRYCLLYHAGNHPDIRRVAPLEGKKGIAVDQVREIRDFMSLRSQYAGYKLVIVTPAETMNINAANSLLKTLEEPSAETLLLLITHLPAQLPATIRSRCQELRFGVPDKQTAKDWLSTHTSEPDNIDLLLALADYAPLRALQLAEDGLLGQRQALMQEIEQLSAQRLDPVTLAAHFCKVGVAESLQILQSWLTDMIRFASSQQPPHHSNPDLAGQLLTLANQVSLQRLFQLQDRISQAQRESERNLNPNLIMESVLIQWQQIFRAQNRNMT